MGTFIHFFHFEGDQSWDFFGRNDAKAETPVLWLPHVKSWLIGKDSVAGRDLGQEEKGMTEDEMAGWYHWTWVWVNSGSWWWTGRPGMLQFMGSQRVGHDWATELNWTDALWQSCLLYALGKYRMLVCYCLSKHQELFSFFWESVKYLPACHYRCTHTNTFFLFSIYPNAFYNHAEQESVLLFYKWETET